MADLWYMISIVINMEGERLLYLHIIILVAVNLPYVESGMYMILCKEISYKSFLCEGTQ